MMFETKISKEYLKKSKYYDYRRYAWGMLALTVILVGMMIVRGIWPYYNGNPYQLTAEEFQNDIYGGAGAFAGGMALSILFFILSHLELKKIQKEDLEKELYGEQKEKEQIENYDPFI